ncbi:MAG: LysR family transcriptional regulator [Eubacteriales bacterium]|nr:LysR family transcriptional regulator [Eubacteriales bacterium]
MDLKQLLYFVTIAEEGTISGAAKKLFLTQPPLSYQMKLLEQELHCTLFERGSRNVQLTDEGRLLYNRSKNILDMAKITKEELLAYSDSNRGTIRIGMVSSVASAYGASWICDFSKCYPDIEFEIYEANTYSLLSKLEENLIHLAFLRSPYPETAFAAHVLASEPLFAIGRREQFSDLDPVPTLSDLSSHPLIIYRRWQKLIDEAFDHAVGEHRYRCVCDDARTTAALCEKGLGIGIVPQSASSTLCTSEMISRPIRDLDLTSNIELVYDKTSYLPSCSKLFIEYILNNPMSR